MEKSKAKSDQKKLQETIENGLIKELKESTSQIAKNSKKLDKLIIKSSRKVAKKITKKVSRIRNKESKVQTSATSETAVKSKITVKMDSKQPKTSPVAKAPVKVTSDTAIQPMTASPVKKPITSRKPRVSK
jgi:hypothetical protein